jgi:hypothetical protein
VPPVAGEVGDGAAVGAPPTQPRFDRHAPIRESERELGTTPRPCQPMLTGAGRRESVYQFTEQEQAGASNETGSSWGER